MFGLSPRVLVLMYHHVSFQQGSYSISPIQFEEQVCFLKQAGYQFLTLQQYADIARSPKSSKPHPRYCMLTFDDGWIDNWIHVFPILRRHDVPAVFFVVSGWMGTGDARLQLLNSATDAVSHEESVSTILNMCNLRHDKVVMRWSELRYIRDNSKIEIADHSYMHGSWWGDKSETILLNDFSEDCANSQGHFKQEMGCETPFYCWPRGEFAPALVAAAKLAGYQLQFSTIRGINVLSGGEARLVRRINVENRDLKWFKRMVNIYSLILFPGFISRMHQSLCGKRLARKYTNLPSQFFKYSIFDKI